MSKNKTEIFRGAATALITPMRDGKIDYAALEHLIDFQIQNGIDALVVAGTSGEASTLSERERRECIRFTIDKTGHRVPVIVGTGSNDTSRAVAFSKDAEKRGADALLVVTPYYNRSSDDGLIEHYRKIAGSVSCPVILYHVPARTGVRLSLGVLSTLAECPNIVGIKEASGDVAFGARIAAQIPSLAVYSGNDELTVPLMSLGALGVISVASNVVPFAMKEMCHDCLEGNFAAARAAQLRLMPLIDALFRENNPIPVKYAAHLMGLCEAEYRLPLCPPKEETKKILKSLLKDFSAD